MKEAAAVVLAKFGALNDIDPDDVGVPREPVKHAKRGRLHDASARRTRPRAGVRQDQRQTDIRQRARAPAHFDSGIGDSYRPIKVSTPRGYWMNALGEIEEILRQQLAEAEDMN
jgi:hypothetical protein